MAIPNCGASEAGNKQLSAPESTIAKVAIDNPLFSSVNRQDRPGYRLPVRKRSVRFGRKDCVWETHWSLEDQRTDRGNLHDDRVLFTLFVCLLDRFRQSLTGCHDPVLSAGKGNPLPNRSILQNAGQVQRRHVTVLHCDPSLFYRG